MNKMQNKKKNISRRKFLKKSVYTAPSLLVLGKLLQPDYANAAPPNGPGSATSGGQNKALVPPQAKNNSFSNQSF